jgi:hypothetical protein
MPGLKLAKMIMKMRNTRKQGNFIILIDSHSRNVKIENLQSSIFKQIKFGETIDDLKKTKRSATPIEMVDKKGKMVNNRSGIEIFKSSIILA